MADETILITGGTGFIGVYTAKSLLEEGHDVVLFDVSTESEALDQFAIADDIEIIAGDVTDAPSVFNAVVEHDVTRIIHLAALLTESAQANPRTAVDVNVMGTNNVFEAARCFSDQVERVVWGSSSGAYAPPHKYDKYDVDEVDEDDLVYPETLYGACKAFNEHQARQYRENYDLSLIGLRPTIVYGPYREGGNTATLMRLMESPALEESVTVGPGDHLLDWLYIDDVVQAFQKATFADEDAFSRHVYNICGERATVREMADVVRDIVDADITVTDEGSLPWTQFLNMDAAREDFGYEPEYGLREGAKRYMNLVRQEHGLEPL